MFVMSISLIESIKHRTNLWKSTSIIQFNKDTITLDYVNRHTMYYVSVAEYFEKFVAIIHQRKKEKTVC